MKNAIADFGAQRGDWMYRLYWLPGSVLCRRFWIFRRSFVVRRSSFDVSAFRLRCCSFIVPVESLFPRAVHACVLCRARFTSFMEGQRTGQSAGAGVRGRSHARARQQLRVEGDSLPQFGDHRMSDQYPLSLAPR